MALTGGGQAVSRTTDKALSLSDKELGPSPPTYQEGDLCCQ